MLITEREQIRLSKCSVGSLEIEAASRAIESQYLGMGQEVALFESEIKSYLNTEFEVISVNSGTSALVAALAALDIGFGDEVLVPSITYVASFQSIASLGATPVACDVDPNTGFLDINDAVKRITSSTKAIMPVHFCSSSKGMEKIYKFSSLYGLRVIEDAAQAFGSQREGNLVGTVGDIICFSFDGIKNITCGEGGAVLTSDKILANRLKDLRLLGVEKDTKARFEGRRSWDFDVKHKGFRFHLSNINASIGRVQLKRIDEFRIKRKLLVKEYINCLSGLNEINFMDINYEEILPHIFVIKVENRDSLREFLLANNIEVGIHYKPNHKLSLFKTSYDLIFADKFYKHAITLPLHFDLDIEDVKYISDQICSFYDA